MWAAPAARGQAWCKQCSTGYHLPMRKRHCLSGLMMYMYIIAPALVGLPVRWRDPRDLIEAAVNTPEAPLVCRLRVHDGGEFRQKEWEQTGIQIAAW